MQKSQCSHLREERNSVDAPNVQRKSKKSQKSCTIEYRRNIAMLSGFLASFPLQCSLRGHSAVHSLSLLSPSVFCSPLRCNRMRQMCFSGSSNQNAITHDHAAGSHRPSSRSPSPLPSSRLLPSRFPPRRLRRRQVPGANWLDRKMFFPRRIAAPLVSFSLNCRFFRRSAVTLFSLPIPSSRVLGSFWERAGGERRGRRVEWGIKSLGVKLGWR